MKNRIVKTILAIALTQSSVINIGHAAESSQKNQTITGEQRKEELRNQIALVTVKLRQINEALESAHRKEDIARIGNSLVIGGEVFAVADILIALKEKNAGKALNRAKYLLAALAAHISFLTLSPERSDSKEEASLEAQKAQLMGILNQLQVELAK